MNRPIAGLMMRQKITMMVNRYRITPLFPDGSEGPLIAFAQQKRLKLREEVAFFTDESKTRIAFSFKSRNIIDMAATTDVLDAEGRPIGVFRKDAARSLLNSTWYLEGPGVQATGRERSQKVAVVRRFGGMLPIVGDLLDLVPWQFHFDFVNPAGETVFVSERQRKVRDEYRLLLPVFGQGRQLDWRLGAAMGVALDAFQGR
ncbi:hypothetical protein [Cumulibacter manganitolerans]|uniref:hypothetical protein n=1 Tax=Cumulibacter manganitolerans TaxID=1884992 RepID=UPI001E3D63A5|nr:hypothetical protein [Cumulibacter manganitolerans]